jgi:DNA-binding response OmpR family regulator
MQIFTRARDGGTEEQAEGRETRPALRRIRLLVVDENETALSVMGRRLSHLGYDVTLAENGFVALNMLVAQKFDLIIIDMGMTMLPGLATLKKMQVSGLLAQASIMMVTGRSDGAAVVEALEAGADDQIVKPFDFDVLDARIRHIVARAQQISEIARHNEQLDARIARRAMELGETRAALEEMQADRSRLVASIQALHEELERLNARQG